MKNSIKHFLLPLVCGIAFISCEKQTTPEPVQIQRPELQSPIVRDDVYYARLRAYKKTDHKLAFGWFASWTALGASDQSRLRSAPDSMVAQFEPGADRRQSFRAAGIGDEGCFLHFSKRCSRRVQG